MNRRESIKRGMGSRWAASMTANTYWTALRDIGEIDGCLWREVCVCVGQGLVWRRKMLPAIFCPTLLILP